jgi:phosphoglycolate phosphatase-like HAD superfamily hydrolase
MADLIAGRPMGPGQGGGTSGIRHVLFDADGVIQTVPGGWHTAMEPYVGQRAQEFLHGAWKDEKPMLAGQGDYLPLLAARLIEFGVPVPAEDVYRDVWHRIEPDGNSLGLVRALRANGYGVHLGTNQERLRAAHMRDALGYGSLFDVCWHLVSVRSSARNPVATRSRRGTGKNVAYLVGDAIRVSV